MESQVDWEHMELQSLPSKSLQPIELMSLAD